MKIDRAYIQTYNQLFLKLISESDQGYLDEAALPSYTHSNKIMAWLFWKRVKTALDMASDLKESSILDFGCGCGVLFNYLDAFNCKITGCDNQFCQMAGKICKILNIKVDMFENINKINDRTFDRIFALDVLEHVDFLDDYVAKLNSLLNRQGRIILSGPTENLIYKAGRKMAGFSGHYHVRNVYDIEEAMAKSKLRRTSLKILPFPIPLFRISTWEKQNSDR